MSESPTPASVKRAVILALIYPSIAFYYAGMSFFGSLRVAVVLALISVASVSAPGHFMGWRAAWTTTFALGTLAFVGIAWLAAVYAMRHGAARQPRTGWKYAQFFAASFVVSIPIAMLDEVPGVRAFKILKETSASMAPTVVVGDRILVDLKAYRTEPPKAGDIVAFETGEPTRIYLKRVVGMPGDKVAVTDMVVYRNGAPVPGPTAAEESDIPYRDTPETVVSEGHVYVVGDNLLNSVDSRVYGEIPLERLLGRAESVLFSMDGVVVAPDRLAMDIH